MHYERSSKVLLPCWSSFRLVDDAETTDDGLITRGRVESFDWQKQTCFSWHLVTCRDSPDAGWCLNLVMSVCRCRLVYIGLPGEQDARKSSSRFMVHFHKAYPAINRRHSSPGSGDILGQTSIESADIDIRSVRSPQTGPSHHGHAARLPSRRFVPSGCNVVGVGWVCGSKSFPVIPLVLW